MVFVVKLFCLIEIMLDLMVGINLRYFLLLLGDKLFCMII